MSPTTKTALKWGLIIGVANLIWLYLAYYLGLHTGGPVLFNVFMGAWLAINVIAYIIALKAVRLQSENWNYFRGLRAGVLASIVAAGVAIIAQVGYWKVVHPDWPEYMAKGAKEFFEAQGLTPEQVEGKVAFTEKNVTLKNYAIQSAASSFFIGAFLSLVTMIFLRRRPADIL